MNLAGEVLRAPLFAVILTVGAYAAVQFAFSRWASGPWASPVLWSTVVVGFALIAFRIPYSGYIAGAQPITFLLGPAVVALAIPIYSHRRGIIRALPAVLGATVAAAAVGVLAGVSIMLLFGSDRASVAVMAPTHATSPVASAVAQATGGIGSLAAALAVVTGILGAVAGPPILTLLRVRDEHARGIAMGLSAHAIGTARALQESPTAGSLSAVGMALGAVAVAVITPVALSLVRA